MCHLFSNSSVVSGQKQLFSIDGMVCMLRSGVGVSHSKHDAWKEHMSTVQSLTADDNIMQAS